jgi:hypothetical protein
LLTVAAPAAAQELSFGLTTDHRPRRFRRRRRVSRPARLRRSGRDLGRLGRRRPRGRAGQRLGRRGLRPRCAARSNAFVEASFMPGYYWQGDTDLGHHLQFRSLIGFGWTLSHNSAVILSLDHISNAGLDIRNPGAETLALRYRLSF